MVAAILLPFLFEGNWFTWSGLVILIGMWVLVGGVGVSVGLHRYFTHRSFVAPKWVRMMLGFVGCMAGQGPVTYWVTIHRCHHGASDKAGDPHSPQPNSATYSNRLMAFAHGHMLWASNHPVPLTSRYAPDLRRDPVVAFVDRHYWAAVIAGLILPGLIGWAIHGNFWGFAFGLYWGGIVRLAVGHHIIWSINSVCHTMGTRAWSTHDHSRNVGLLSLISFGESWHNNHHHDPASARFGRGWRQIDVGWMFIRLLQAFRLATHVKS